MSYQIIGNKWTPPDLFVTREDAERFAEQDYRRSELGNYEIVDVGPLCTECGVEQTMDDDIICAICAARIYGSKEKP